VAWAIAVLRARQTVAGLILEMAVQIRRAPRQAPPRRQSVPCRGCDTQPAEQGGRRDPITESRPAS
jgi:hypothetical protein